MQQVAGGQGRVDRHPAAELHDVGLERLYALLPGDGDTVVAVADEVGVPDLVQAHRGQVFVFVHELVYALPAGAEVWLGGQEGAVEVPVAPDAADDL